MTGSYSDQLLEQRNNERRATRPWLECYICQTPPTFEDVKAHFAEQGMLVTRADYQAVCEKMCVKPRWAHEKTPEQPKSLRGESEGTDV